MTIAVTLTMSSTSDVDTATHSAALNLLASSTTTYCVGVSTVMAPVLVVVSCPPSAGEDDGVRDDVGVRVDVGVPVGVDDTAATADDPGAGDAAAVGVRLFDTGLGVGVGVPGTDGVVDCDTSGTGDAVGDVDGAVMTH